MNATLYNSLNGTVWLTVPFATTIYHSYKSS